MHKENATKEDLVIEDIVDIFEEFLNIKDIELPNGEKELIPKDIYPNIIGRDYGYLVGRITELFRFWNVSCNDKDEECRYCLQHSALSRKRRSMRSIKFSEGRKGN